MTVPGDEGELRHEIEQTRDQLAQTVEQLAAKADVKATARAKVAHGRQRMKSEAARIRARAAAKAGPVWRKAPEPVQRSLARGASTAQQRPIPIAAVAAMLLAGYLAMRRWARR
jgi:cell division septum initiation protein DivIVA